LEGKRQTAEGRNAFAFGFRHGALGLSSQAFFLPFALYLFCRLPFAVCPLTAGYTKP
jgi:hypothetical protein